MFVDPFAPPRYLMNAEQAAAAMATIEFEFPGMPRPAAPASWISCEPSFKERVLEAAGLSWSDMLRASATPSLRMPLTEDLVASIVPSVIYSATADTFSTHYYIEYIPSNGRLILKYQRILGSRFLFNFSEVAQAELFDRLVEQARAFGKTKGYAAIQDKARVVEAQVAARNDAWEASQRKVTPAPLQAAPAELREELALLRPEGASLMLPEQHLQSYAAIKRLLETAGGKYVTRSKSFLFKSGDAAEVLEKLLGGEKVNPKKDFQFFASTEPVKRLMRSQLPDLQGLDALEPSAGDGELADMARDMGAKVTTVELWDVNAAVLRQKGYTPLEKDFLTVTPEEVGLFDVIVANPPFTRGLDIEHFMHMTRFLKPGGTLCCVMSATWQEGKQRKQQSFRKYLEQADVTIDSLPAGTFKESGTSVGALMLTLRAPQVVSASKPALAESMAA